MSQILIPQNLDVIRSNLNSLLDEDKKTVYVTHDGVTRILVAEFIHQYIQDVATREGCLHLDLDELSNNIYNTLKTNNTVDEINEHIISCAAELACIHYDYPRIATRILVDDLHAKTSDDFMVVTQALYDDKSHERSVQPLNADYYAFIVKNKDTINKMINYDMDYTVSFFGFRTLERSYLKRLSNRSIIERPQHMYMRVAIGIHYARGSMEQIEETYRLMSQGYFTHATPTIFNAGTNISQLSSCFLMGIDDDMEAVGDCIRDSCLFSKYAGGIGIHVSNIRSFGSFIASTQGSANGLKLLTVFNQVARYVNQGGKRAGSMAFYVEPWHADIFFFLDLRKNTGAETERARDIFLGLMVNDYFMRQVKADGPWYLMCPADCPNIVGKYGKEFDDAYDDYIAQGKYKVKLDARDLWFKILETQFETGTPYILFKDACNEKSNQKNIGTINGSNLCAEILEVSSDQEYAVCNLASIALPKFITYDADGKPTFDYQELYRVCRLVTRNLDSIIDINFYPVEKARKSNMAHRPIGLGVQGLANVFAIFKTPFDSPLARDMNKKIFETIQFAAISVSNLLAQEFGPYSTYAGSPISKGIFQHNMWGLKNSDLSGLWDWDELMRSILMYGVRNSLVTANMPTATTAQILGNNECFEPFTENVYTRETLAGEYYVVNHHLMKHLMELGLWTKDLLDQIKMSDGSFENIQGIPDDVKRIYRTVWDISQKSIIEMAADRGAFCDQTQSMNLFFAKPNNSKLSSCLFKAWELGLKTGVYYMRSKPKSSADKFGVDIKKITGKTEKSEPANNEPCLMCSA